jgi:Tol biopolymer transport system component
MQVRRLVLVLLCVSVTASLLVAGASADRSPGEPAEGLYVFDPSSAALKLVIKGEEDDPSWSPDGRWLVALDTNSLEFNVVDPAGGSRRQVGSSVAWSNDASRVAYSPSEIGRNASLVVARSDWSKPRVVARAQGIDPFSWAPGDREFAFGVGSTETGGGCCWRSLRIASADGTRPRTVWTGSTILSAAWSPSGRLLAVMDDGGHVHLVPASGGGKAQTLPGKWSASEDPEWSADGKWLFVGSDSSTEAGLSTTMPNTRPRVLCANCRIMLSPDRRRVAFVDARFVLWLENVDGSGKRRLAEGVLPDSFNWSPDGGHLVVALGQGPPPTPLALIDIATGAVRPLTHGSVSDLARGGVSPDGNDVAFIRVTDNGLQLWVVRSDGTEAREVTPFGTCSTVRWAPKAALLAVTNLDDC